MSNLSLIKKSYLLDDFLKEFPNRDAFADQRLKSSYDEKIRNCEPIEFLPNIPNEGSYPSLTDRRRWEYGIAMVGILPDGRRSIVMIDGIQPYFLVEKPKLIVGYYPGEVPPGADEQQYHQINEQSKFNFMNEIKGKIAGNDAAVSYQWESGKPFVGWQHENTDYLKLTFTKQSSRRKMMTLLRQANYVTFHDDYSDYFRVVARDYNIPLCSWTMISNYTIDQLDNFKQPIIRVHVSNFVRYEGEVLKNPTLARDKSMIMAWDIECATKTGNLPSAEVSEDKMFMICASVHWWYTKTPLVKICFVDQPSDEHKDYITVVCGSEKNVILGFAYLFEKLKPDFCTGFNSSNFDFPWFVQRAYQHGLLETLCDIMNEIKPFNGFDRGGVKLGHKLMNMSYESWARIESKKKIPKVSLNNYLAYICPIYCYEKVKIDAETYAEGTQLQTGGCISFDLMTIFRQLYPNSEKNSLDYFLTANKLSGKKDMPVHELFRIYWEMDGLVNSASAYFSDQSISSENKASFMSRVSDTRKLMREVAEYCVIDSFRCQELALMRNVIADKREVSALSDTSLPDAFFRANGMKVRQMVMKRGIERNLKFTTVNKVEHGTDKYPGAYVLPPEKGLITSKLTLSERLEKHNDYVARFGPTTVNDGSYRTLPYTEISTFGNNNVNEFYNRAIISNYTELINNADCTIVPNIASDVGSLEEKKEDKEFAKTDATISEKIATFQRIITEYANENKEFVVVDCKEEHIFEVIKRTSEALAIKNIKISKNDATIFATFLKESTGRPITGLDFSSLYPSLIMTYNLSPEYTISLETCNNSVITVKNKVIQARQVGHQIRRVEFDYGEQKRKIYGFFVSHENQFPKTDDGKVNPNCKFGVYPTILKELFDQRKLLKVPKEYYEILNEHLDKLNDSNIKYNRIIKLCSSAFAESIDLNEYKDFETLFDDYEELKTLKDIKAFSKFNFPDFVGFMKSAPVEIEKISKIELAEAIKVIQHKVDFDHAYKPPRRLKNKEGVEQFTPDAKVKKVLCAFEDEEMILSKGGISWEDIEFYFNYFDSKQKALKVFMNTFYGESGNKLSSMFVLAVAGSVTTQGQINLKRVITFVEGREGSDDNGKPITPNTIGKFKVVYGDTDSAYIGAPESVFRDLDIQYYSGQITKENYWTQMVELSFVYIDKIKEEVNKMLARTSGSKFLTMAYEEVLFPVAFLAKKKYYGIPHISIPNFNPKKLFVRGLETKKRGVSGVLKDLCESLMWKSMKITNNKELLELGYDAIEEFYKKSWSVDQFGKTAQYKPKSEEDIAEGKGNKSVLRFIERMKIRGIDIKPHERFRYVIVRKYPYEYDYRGRKVHLKIGDFMELVDVAKKENMDINIDYYMENGIIGQLARLCVYRDEFYIESLDDSDEEIKKADDASYKKAKSHLDQFASRYYKVYQDKGVAYQNTFKTIDKRLKQSYRDLGLDREHVDLLCKDWEYESPDLFFHELSQSAEKKAIKSSKNYGLGYVIGLTKPNAGIKPIDLTTLQRMYCGPNASHMKTVIEAYRNNLIIVERDFRNMFNDFFKLMNEHRRAINVMSILVNKAVGIDTLYNDPVKLEGGQKIRANRKEIKEYDPKAHQTVLLDLSVLDEDDDHEDDDDTDPSTKTKIKEIAMSRFPKEEFEELFVETESHLKGSFNIREMADRLFAISNTLYRTYLFYNQNLDVQTYLESQLDKKYRINTTPVTRVETRELIEEAIEEGLRNNIIDIDF
jgi:DNA polymerase elongation subunit (family B)